MSRACGRHGVRAVALVTTLVFAITAVQVWGPRRAARAQGKKKVFSIAVSGDLYSQKPAALMNYQFHSVLATIPEAIVIDPEIPLEEFQSNDLQTACKQADEFLAKGKGGFENLEMDEAVKNLSRALGNYWKCAAYIGDGRQYVETLQYLGGAYIVKGEKSLGLEMFKKAVIFNPKAELNPQTFPPEMAEVYKAAREEVDKLPTGSINVISIPAGAEIYIDGAFAGIAPRTKDHIPVGNHFISVKRYGYVSDGARVDVVPADEVAYQAQLIPTKKFSEYNQFESNVELEANQDGVGAMVSGLARLTTAQAVIVSSVKRDGGDVNVTSHLYDINAGKKLNKSAKTFNLDSTTLFADIKEFVNALVRGETVPSGPVGPVGPVAQPTPPGGPVGPERQQLAPPPGACRTEADCKKGEQCAAGACKAIEKDEGDAFYKTWWFWTIVGGAVVVAGGTTATVLLLAGENGASTGVIGFKY